MNLIRTICCVFSFTISVGHIRGVSGVSVIVQGVDASCDGCDDAKADGATSKLTIPSVADQFEDATVMNEDVNGVLEVQAAMYAVDEYEEDAPIHPLEALRRLATSNCMEDLAGKVGCTANDVKFDAITGFTVFDSLSYTDPISGIVYGACLGNDDNVRVSFTMNLTVSTDRYDFGMYINTVGGNALTGVGPNDCTVVGLKAGTYGGVTVKELETNSDKCLDVDAPQGGAVLKDFPFAPITLACSDTNGDGLLDFDIAISFDNNDGGYYCDINDPLKPPLPGASSKCWYDKNNRVTLNINVPPYPAPTTQPSKSDSTILILYSVHQHQQSL